MFAGKIFSIFYFLIFRIKIFIAKNVQDDMSTRKYLCWRKNGFLVLKGFSVLLQALSRIPAYTNCTVITTS